MKALFNRLIREGYADYYTMQRGTIRDVFTLLMLLEWNDHVQAYMDVLKKANS